MASSTKITKRTVDAAKPGAARYTIWDSELKGFGLRVAQSGTKTYFVRYRVRAARRRLVVLGRHGVITPDEARNRARVLTRIHRGAASPPGDGRARTRGAYPPGQMAGVRSRQDALERAAAEP
jgi:hypothetical protein